MSFQTEGKLNDFIPVVGVIQPQSITAGATGVLTAAIDMRDFQRVVGVLESGTLGTSGTLDFLALSCDTSGGTYVAISGRAITQLVKATGDNKLAVIDVRNDDLPATHRYVKFQIVAGTAAATSSAVVLGVPANRSEGGLLNLAAVAQVV